MEGASSARMAGGGARVSVPTLASCSIGTKGPSGVAATRVGAACVRPRSLIVVASFSCRCTSYSSLLDGVAMLLADRPVYACGREAMDRATDYGGSHTRATGDGRYENVAEADVLSLGNDGRAADDWMRRGGGAGRTRAEERTFGRRRLRELLTSFGDVRGRLADPFMTSGYNVMSASYAHWFCDAAAGTTSRIVLAQWRRRPDGYAERNRLRHQEIAPRCPYGECEDSIDYGDSLARAADDETYGQLCGEAAWPVPAEAACGPVRVDSAFKPLVCPCFRLLRRPCSSWCLGGGSSGCPPR